MNATATAHLPAALFPDDELRSAIEGWWEEQSSNHLDDPFATPGTLFDVLVEVDSLTAVNILLLIEPILGLKPPESLIRPGGYTDRNDMTAHLLPGLRKLFDERNLKSTMK